MKLNTEINSELNINAVKEAVAGQIVPLKSVSEPQFAFVMSLWKLLAN